MESANNSSPVSRVIPVLIFFAGLIALYYLYQYLFGPKTGSSYSLIEKNQTANIDPVKPIIVTSDKLPILYEGGEFTVSTWIYISNWAYRTGYNKSIMSVGGPNLDIIRIYLGGNKPKLFVRLHTKESGSVPGGAIGSNVGAGTSSQIDDLSVATRDSVFKSPQTDSGMLDESISMCDLPEVQLQRWVNITVAVNGKTVDVYMDGKLSRSCVLPTFYKVDAGGYSANLLAYGGFGGQISTTTMYDAALNPEAVYRNYMAGPEPINTFGDWLSSIFMPGVSISVSSK
jgi:hypothetical protein